MSSQRNQLIKKSKNDLIKQCIRLNVLSTGTKAEIVDRILKKTENIQEMNNDASQQEAASLNSGLLPPGLSMTDVIDRIDTGLSRYYMHENVEYFLDDGLGDGKFKHWCNSNGYSNDKVLGLLNRHLMDMRVFTLWKFDKDFPTNIDDIYLRILHIHKVMKHCLLNEHAFSYSNKFDQESMSSSTTFVSLNNWDLLVFGFLRMVSETENCYIPRDVLLLCVSYCKVVLDKVSKKMVGDTDSAGWSC